MPTMAPKTATKAAKESVTRKAATRAMKQIKKKPAGHNLGKEEQKVNNAKKKDKKPRQLHSSQDFTVALGPGMSGRSLNSPLWQLAVSVANLLQNE